ncbi:PLP-dependent aminotransferase family protein [Pseudomonas putida]|uniref:aminotransferase class I/II-fold pyridoxal phosphate-dependent enzyme n=1 Tax=Pseudomonas putida TaxID=303 RepID=UPI000DB2CEBB|nr:PLP-dependent aminotransferase family protein [Pseudomonas putida]MBI6939872.1 PLP-dependent aminotransferase family protein [Pseudomonas putida]MBI6956158.1 PLP-dependent aminotransferase family protein [Pseudomonas putida]PZQ42445.1 MAG: GntR family transcriptional regulator [Pseudomonas putida]
MGREFAYQTVYHYLQALIDEAERGGQTRLPSLRALSRRLRVSLATVQAAYGLLEHEGRVLSVPKSGYFVQARGAAPPLGDRMMSAQLLIERTLFAHERRLARQRKNLAPAPQSMVGTRLRNALAERYTRSSRQTWRAEDVHLGHDVQALLETLFAALALQGCTVLVASPCCWRLLGVLQRLGMQVQELPLNTQGVPDLGSLARMLRQTSVRMMIMPSCLGLPLGRLMTAEDQQQIAEVLAGYPVWLLENDLDSERCFSTPPASRLRDWVDPGRLLVLGSLEAAVGAEAPYAYVLSRHTALAEAFALRAFHLPPLRQQALAQMFAKGEIDAQLCRLRVLLQRRMELFCQQLATRLGRQVDFAMPDGGQVVWVRLQQPVQVDRLLAVEGETALQVLTGARFSLQGHFQQYLALTWAGGQADELDKALSKLANALSSGI